MPNLTPHTANPTVFERDNELWTTSLDVARVFEKRHADVIRSIEQLECSQDFTERNFALSDYPDSTGRTLPMFEMTQDGFAFLAMGFTGKRAAQFKEWYISEFNRQRKALIASRDLIQQLLIQGKKTEERLVALLENHSVGIGVLDSRVGKVEAKVDEISTELTGIKNALPLKRRDLSKDTISKHIQCVFDDYDGRCPCCNEVVIVDHNRRKTNDCADGHYLNRHENSLDKTWLICSKCNSNHSSGKADHQIVTAYFNAYQARLKANLAKCGTQLSMAQLLQLKVGIRG